MNQTKNNDKFILKFLRKYKGSTIVKQLWKARTKLEGLITWFKTYNTATILKTVYNWHKNRQIQQWNKQQARNRFIHIWLTDYQPRQQLTVRGKNLLANKWGEKQHLNNYVISYTKKLKVGYQPKCKDKTLRDV